jgi:hypothetical protein
MRAEKRVAAQLISSRVADLLRKFTGRGGAWLPVYRGCRRSFLESSYADGDVEVDDKAAWMLKGPAGEQGYTAVMRTWALSETVWQ